jgi:hypothetical protein
MNSLSELMPDEAELWRRVMDSFSSKIRVAAPGIIQKFDAAKQTVEVKIAIRERINDAGAMKDVEIPKLVDVPIIHPRSGGFALTLPISVGDECLVVFGDSCMDAWWQSGKVQNPMEKRRHDLSDGFAIIGVGSQPKVLSNYSSNSAQLRNAAGDVMVEVKGDVVNIGGSTFRKLIDERIKQVFDAHVHLSASPGAPTGAPTDCTTTKVKGG